MTRFFTITTCILILITIFSGCAKQAVQPPTPSPTAAQSTPTATPPSATQEPTKSPTPSPEPTESTPEPTPSTATPEPTPEPTPSPATPEPTPEPTPSPEPEQAPAETASALFKAGKYVGEGQGFGGKIVMEIEVDENRILNISTMESSETAGISDPAFEKIPASIIEAQSASVDTVSGCTLSSKGIIDAVNSALNSAGTAR